MSYFENDEAETRFGGIYAAIEAIFVRCFSVNDMKYAVERLKEFVEYTEKRMNK